MSAAAYQPRPAKQSSLGPASPDIVVYQQRFSQATANRPQPKLVVYQRQSAKQVNMTAEPCHQPLYINSGSDLRLSTATSEPTAAIHPCGPWLCVSSHPQRENTFGTAVYQQRSAKRKHVWHSSDNDGCISTQPCQRRLYTHINSRINTHSNHKAKASGTAVPVITVYQQLSVHQPYLCNHRHQQNMQSPLIKLHPHELYINSKERYSGRNSDPCQP